MTTTLATRKSASEIIAAAKANIQNLALNVHSTKSWKYRHFVLKEAKKYKLNEKDIKQLADHLGIDWFSPPSSVPASWIPSICEKFMSVKYVNPDDNKDYVILISSRSVFGIKGVIRHTPHGYLDTKWFTDFVPMLISVYESYERALGGLPSTLDPLMRAKKERALMTHHVNGPINQAYSQGLQQEELRSIHAFFKTYLPGVDLSTRGRRNLQKLF